MDTEMLRGLAKRGLLYLHAQPDVNLDVPNQLPQLASANATCVDTFQRDLTARFTQQTNAKSRNKTTSQTDVRGANYLDGATAVYVELCRSFIERGASFHPLRHVSEHFATPCLDWDARLRIAATSLNHQERPAIWMETNEKILPHATTEEVALQILAQRLIYLAPELGAKLCFSVVQELDGTPSKRLAKKYVLTGLVASRVGCCIAYRFEPECQDQGASIICFRGTRPGFSLPAGQSLPELPIGLADDFHPKGVGYEGYQDVRLQVLAWVRSDQARYGAVCVTGHSLGGALSVRLKADLSEQLQAATHLVTFSAPGLEAEVNDNLYAGAGTTRTIWHFADPIVLLAGDCHPRGKSYQVYSPVNGNSFLDDTHGNLALTNWNIFGQPIDVCRLTKVKSPVSAHGEDGRRLFGEKVSPWLRLLGIR